MPPLRMALLGLAACYPLSGVALIAGIAASDKAWWSYPLLLGFYGLTSAVLRRLAGQAPGGRGLFFVALGLVAGHASLATLFCAQAGSSADALVTLLLLLICPIMMLIGLACGQTAQALGQNFLAMSLRTSAVAWLPLMPLNVIPFLVSFAVQCLLVLALAGCMQVRPVQEEGLGFNRFS